MRSMSAWASFLFAAIVSVLPASSQSRGMSVNRTADTASISGNFYALVIGVNNYSAGLPHLKTAVSDARAIEEALRTQFGFHTTLLVDATATRANILNALNQYRNTLAADDSLLIYYAGHGFADHEADKAYWLPADADSSFSANRISADDITTAIRVQPARHVLIISDSCYSGALTRDATTPVSSNGQQAYLRRMVAGRSRNLMASGGDEPVADAGANGHSVFANAVLRALERQQAEVFTASDLFYDSIRQQVAGSSEQLPQYSIIRNSSHDDGDFVFVRPAKVAAVTLSPATPIATPNPEAAPTINVTVPNKGDTTFVIATSILHLRPGGPAPAELILLPNGTITYAEQVPPGVDKLGSAWKSLSPPNPTYQQNWKVSDIHMECDVTDVPPGFTIPPAFGNFHLINLTAGTFTQHFAWAGACKDFQTFFFRETEPSPSQFPPQTRMAPSPQPSTRDDYAAAAPVAAGDSTARLIQVKVGIPVGGPFGSYCYGTLSFDGRFLALALDPNSAGASKCKKVTLSASRDEVTEYGHNSLPIGGQHRFHITTNGKHDIVFDWAPEADVAELFSALDRTGTRSPRHQP